MPPEVNYRSGHFPARKLLWLVEVLEVGWNRGIRLKFKAAPGTLCFRVHVHPSSCLLVWACLQLTSLEKPFGSQCPIHGRKYVQSH